MNKFREQISRGKTKKKEIYVKKILPEYKEKTIN